MSSTKEDACRHGQQCTKCELWYCADDQISTCSTCYDLDSDVLCMQCLGAPFSDPHDWKRICEECFTQATEVTEWHPVIPVFLVAERSWTSPKHIQLRCDVCQELKATKRYQCPKHPSTEGPTRWVCLECLYSRQL
jgi:hypothetical protein